jgi:hypothetical protein
MLDQHIFVVLEKPAGGCYLVSKTLVLQAGSYLFGKSANNPNNDGSNGVVIRLAPNSNVPLLRTFAALNPAGGGNEFMAVENIAFDGNGANQTQELQGQALVDFRGTFIQTFLRHVMITNAFGPGLFTGSTELDNVWIFGCSTSTYSWIHNPGQTGLGALLANQVYVEESIKPNSGAFRSPWGTGSPVNDPSTFAHAILLNGLSSATFNQLHCESASTCVDFNDVQNLTIHGISGSRIGNPSSPDPTDQYLMRALNKNILAFTFSEAYFDQSGSTYQGNFPNSRVFGFAAGIENHDMLETPPGRLTWPLYTWGRADQGYTGTPFLGERPVVANDLFIKKIGAYSPNRLAFFDEQDAPNGSYSFLERNGNFLSLGFSPGPINVNEFHMLTMAYFGPNNPGNGIALPDARLQTGTADNTDLVGELTFSSASSATFNFLHTYNSHPECTATPQFALADGNRQWITYASASSFTINFAGPVTGAVSYTCLGRN